VIKTPMDLTTIEVKLENNEYSEPKLILSDMRREFTFSLNLSLLHTQTCALLLHDVYASSVHQTSLSSLHPFVLSSHLPCMRCVELN
jgi:hypothetical protein